MSLYLHVIAFDFLHVAKFSCGQLLTYQCAEHRNATARIAPFKSKCARHMVTKGSIHHLDYDEDVFTCIQTRSGLTKIMNSFVEFRFVF